VSTTAIQPPDRKSKNGKGPTVEEARHLAVLVLQGMSAAKAYALVYPLRKKGSIKNRSRMGRLIYQNYMADYRYDLKETAERHRITADRYFGKLDQLLEAKRYDEVVGTRLIEPDPESSLQFKPFVVQERNSELLEDGPVQLGAAKEVGRALGIGPQPGDGGNGTMIQGNVYVVRIGSIEKTPQERALRAIRALAGPKEEEP
jgi:hypothetical protein